MIRFLHELMWMGCRANKSWLARQWSGTDRRFIKPLLTHSYPTLLDTLPSRCHPLAR